MKTKALLVSLLTALVLMYAFVFGAVSASASTTVTQGTFAGCTVADNGVFSCPQGYATSIYYNVVPNGMMNGVPVWFYNGSPYFACTDKDVRCAGYGNSSFVNYPYNNGLVYGYPTYNQPAPLSNVVSVYRDNRYCFNGTVVVTNEGGNLIDRCTDGTRIYPVFADYGYGYRLNG